MNYALGMATKVSIIIIGYLSLYKYNDPDIVIVWPVIVLIGFISNIVINTYCRVLYNKTPCISLVSHITN